MGQVDIVGGALNTNGNQQAVMTAPVVFPPVTEENISATIARLEHRATIGTRAPERQKRGGRQYGGSVNGGLRPMSAGFFFTMAFGEPVSSTQPDATNAPTVWRHVWNPLAAGKKPMPANIWTVNADDPADVIVDKYEGVMLNDIGWTLESNDYLLFTSALQALRNIEDEPAPVATRDQTELWSFDEVLAEISVPSISAGAWEEVHLYGWNFSYSNQNTGADRFRIGSKEAPRIRVGNINSTVGFTFAERISENYRRAIADQPELVKMRLTAESRELYNGGGTPANALYEGLAIEFKALEYSSGDVPISAENVLEDIEIEANTVIDTSGNLLTITLTNEHNGSAYRAPVV